MFRLGLQEAGVLAIKIEECNGQIVFNLQVRQIVFMKGVLWKMTLMTGAFQYTPPSKANSIVLSCNVLILAEFLLKSVGCLAEKSW